MFHEFGSIAKTINRYEHDFFSVSKLSEILDVSCQTIKKYIKDGSLKATKIGGVWRVPKIEVVRYLQENNSYNL